MMIGPETYYEEYIKGKTKEQMLRKIAGLKREIAQLKRTLEHPDYVATMHPSEDTRLWCTRLYLERAKEALADVGAVYEPTAAELRVMDFDANIGNIAKITLNIGGFFSGWKEYTAAIGETVQFSVEDNYIVPPIAPEGEDEDPMTKEEFLELFADLHIGEWRRHYDTTRFGFDVLDGTQWELTIEYNNGRKAFKVGGSNAYPYNFKRLTELFGIDDTEEPEEDEE